MANFTDTDILAAAELDDTYKHNGLVYEFNGVTPQEFVENEYSGVIPTPSPKPDGGDDTPSGDTPTPPSGDTGGDYEDFDNITEGEDPVVPDIDIKDLNLGAK